MVLLYSPLGSSLSNRLVGNFFRILGHSGDEFGGEAVASGAVDCPARLNFTIQEAPDTPFEPGFPWAVSRGDQPLLSSLWLNGCSKCLVGRQCLVNFVSSLRLIAIFLACCSSC